MNFIRNISMYVYFKQNRQLYRLAEDLRMSLELRSILYGAKVICAVMKLNGQYYEEV